MCAMRLKFRWKGKNKKENVNLQSGQLQESNRSEDFCKTL